MAFDANRLALTVDSIGGGSLRIHFLQTDDDRATVTADGYLTFARRLGVREGDLILVHDPSANDVDAGTYITRVSELNDLGHGTLIADTGEAPLPDFTFRANDGSGHGGRGVTYTAARQMLGVDRVTNKSEFELVAGGPIGDALAARISEDDLGTALQPILLSLDDKASTSTLAGISNRVTDVRTDLTTLTGSVALLPPRILAVEQRTITGVVSRKTYAELTGPFSETVSYQVPSTDTGSHDGIASEAGYNSTTGKVPNRGTFAYMGSPLALRRTSDTPDQVVAAQLAASLTPGAAPADGVQLVLIDPATLSFKLLSVEASKAYIRENMVEKLYDETLTLQVGTTSHVLYNADPTVRRINFEGLGTVGVCQKKKATLDKTTPTFIAYNGQDKRVEFGEGGCGPLSFVSDIPGPVSIVISHLSPMYTKTKLVADERLSYWPDAVDDRFYAAMREALNGCDTDDTLKNMKWGFCAGQTAANNIVNIFNLAALENGDEGKYVPGTSGLTTTPFKGVKSNSADAYIDTGLFFADLDMTISSHFMAVMPSETTLDPDGIMLSLSADNIFITPNITSTKARSRSGPAVDDLAATPGKWLAMSRTNGDSYTQYVDGLPVGTVNRPSPDIPSRTLRFLGTPVVGGISAHSSIGGRFGLAGSAINSPASMKKIYDRFKPVFDLQDLLATGA